MFPFRERDESRPGAGQIIPEIIITSEQSSMAGIETVPHSDTSSTSTDRTFSSDASTSSTTNQSSNKAAFLNIELTPGSSPVRGPTDTMQHGSAIADHSEPQTTFILTPPLIVFTVWFILSCMAISYGPAMMVSIVFVAMQVTFAFIIFAFIRMICLLWAYELQRSFLAGLEGFVIAFRLLWTHGPRTAIGFLMYGYGRFFALVAWHCDFPAGAGPLFVAQDVSATLTVSNGTASSLATETTNTSTASSDITSYQRGESDHEYSPSEDASDFSGCEYLFDDELDSAPEDDAADALVSLASLIRQSHEHQSPAVRQLAFDNLAMAASRAPTVKSAVKRLGELYSPASSVSQSMSTSFLDIPSASTPAPLLTNNTQTALSETTANVSQVKSAKAALDSASTNDAARDPPAVDEDLYDDDYSDDDEEAQVEVIIEDGDDFVEKYEMLVHPALAALNASDGPIELYGDEYSDSDSDDSE